MKKKKNARRESRVESVGFYILLREFRVWLTRNLQRPLRGWHSLSCRSSYGRILLSWYNRLPLSLFLFVERRELKADKERERKEEIRRCCPCTLDFFFLVLLLLSLFLSLIILCKYEFFELSVNFTGAFLFFDLIWVYERKRNPMKCYIEPEMKSVRKKK